MGRVTYEEMAEFWPDSDDEYAAPMNEIPKVVFSKDARAGGLARVAHRGRRTGRRDRRAEREPGKDMIAWGGAALAQSLTRLELVDEYRLVLQPVALGEGLPLFKGLSAPLRLELVEATTYSTGAALHIYRPASQEATTK